MCCVVLCCVAAGPPSTPEALSCVLCCVAAGPPSTPEAPAAAGLKESRAAQELGGAMSVIGQKDEQPPKATADPDVAPAAKISLTEG